MGYCDPDERWIKLARGGDAEDPLVKEHVDALKSGEEAQEHSGAV